MVEIVNVLVQAVPSLPVLVFLINHLLMVVVNVLVQAVPSLPVLVFFINHQSFIDGGRNC